MEAFKEKVKSNKKLKKLARWMLFPKHDFRPRWWVRNIWNPFQRELGKGSILRTSRLDVLPFNKFVVGERTLIEDFTVVNNQVGDIFIGNDCLIGVSNAIIGPVKIGNSVIMAQNVTVSGLNHNYKNPNVSIIAQNVNTSQIVIEDDVWLGANVVILSSVTIGKHSIIAAGCVVTRDIPPYSIVVGNPGKVVKQYNPESEKWEKVNLSEFL